MQYMEKKLKVSVCVVTYNHEKYIRQCLQSIVDQETDFDFEVIVGDDCSKDGTRQIVESFFIKYPKLIKPVFHEKNIGAAKNYFKVHSLATGEFIAHMDGDDYLLPNKLLTQAKFMDKNIECVLSGHDMLFLNEKGSFSTNHKFLPEISDIKSFLQYGNFLAHSSTMYRSIYKLSNTLDQEPLDFQVHVDRVKSGIVGYINKPLGVYRVHDGGMVASYFKSTKMFEKNISAILSVERFLKGEESELVNKALYLLGIIWIKNFIVLGETKLAHKVYEHSEFKRLRIFQKIKLKLFITFRHIVKPIYLIKRGVFKW
ncbi:MAG: glycosyltransferase [Polaromonas sp.]|nr:glycosyltransferase [Polaromonas sp.]